MNPSPRARGIGERARRLVLRASAIAAAMVLAVPIVLAVLDLDRMARLALERYGPAGAESVASWRELLDAIAALPDSDKLARVNDFFNRRTRFEDDATIWQREDYWATPLETLGIAAGDCEDFSIAKYVSLRLAGVPGERLRLLYVRARIGTEGSGISQAHMVLGYYPAPDAEPLLLDNLIGEIRVASRRPDLYPVFGFNSESLWVGQASAPSGDSTARLSRWRNVRERMRKDGLP